MSNSGSSGPQGSWSCRPGRRHDHRVSGGVHPAPSTRRDPVAAQPAAAASAPPAAAEYCAAFRRAFAANLGVDESALAPAANRPRSRPSTMPWPGADDQGGRRPAEGPPRGRHDRRLRAPGRQAARDQGRRQGRRPGSRRRKRRPRAAAKALGMTPAELGARLRAGKSLKDRTRPGVPYATVSGAASQQSRRTSTRRSPRAPSSRPARTGCWTGSSGHWRTAGSRRPSGFGRFAARKPCAVGRFLSGRGRIGPALVRGRASRRPVLGALR